MKINNNFDNYRLLIKYIVRKKMIFPYFRRVTKHEPVVVHRQQGLVMLTMSGVFADYSTRGSTQKERVWPPNGFDRSVDLHIRS